MNTLEKIFIVLVFFVITISACSPKNKTTRDLSTPSKIIVGHWRSPDDWPEEWVLEWYFGNFDENGNARCFSNDPPDRESKPYTCQIYEVQENRLWIRFLMEDGKKKYQFPFTPSNDGQTMIFDDDVPLDYIDSTTEPESAN